MKRIVWFPTADWCASCGELDEHGGGGFFDSKDDAAYLDKRTAAVLALGEWMLQRVNEDRTVASWARVNFTDAPVLAALAADKAPE